MASTAQFQAVSANLNNPYHVAVFFTEQGHGAHGFRFINRLQFNNYIEAVPDLFVHTLLDCRQFFLCNAAQMREVKAKTTRFDQRTRLVHVIS
ncbi:hypothetical protein D3C71_1431670 [compost metagenome]